MSSKLVPKGEDSEVVVSSDDELLTEVKRKSLFLLNNEKKVKCEPDSDDGAILPSVFVSVEMQEIEDQPLNCSKKMEPDKLELKLNRKHDEKIKYARRKVFPCQICGETFTKTVDLKEHLIIHPSRHKCEDCGRCFRKAFNLKLHKRVHQKEERCPVCDQLFTLKVHLVRHLNSHKRTEQCESCPAMFHTKTQLEDHCKIHEQITLPKITIIEQPLNLHPSVNQPKVEDAQCQVTDTNISESEHSNDKYSSKEITVLDDLSHSTKCAILTKLHKGRSIADVCKLYNLNEIVVNELWEERDKYTLPKRAGGKSTQYMNSILDTQIIEWFNSQRAQDIQVSGKMLQDQAELFAKERGFVYFNGTRKWLDRFKKRYNISFRGLTKKSYTIPSESKFKQQFFKENWRDVRFQVADEDIYTADEVGLFYNSSKGRIKKMAGKKYIQGHVKDRLAIFMCTNATGTDKKRLLVCGTDDPLIRSLRDPDSLPVNYIRHSQAHFTTEMFEEYVTRWNRELQMLNKKTILILDRATIHSKLQLSHLKLVFVPWKASKALMPIQNGIFTKFRDEFRKLILQEKVRNALRGVDRNLTCLEGLNMLGKAWERTPIEIINKAFIDTGYDVKRIDSENIEKKDKVDDENLSNILKDYDIEPYYTDLSQLDMYLTVDDELLTAQGTNCSVFGGNHRIFETRDLGEEEIGEILPIGTERPDTDEIEILVEKTRAKCRNVDQYNK